MYWVGHIALLVSILAIFVSLGIGYWLRSENSGQNWQPVELPRLLILSTILLLSVSAFMEVVRYASRQDNLNVYSVWLVRTTIFAGAFVVTQALCWRLIIKANPESNSNERFFYVLTGAHALHVIGGMVSLGYLIWRIWNPWQDNLELRRNTITTIVASYWHFMSLIWLGLYALMTVRSS